MHVLAAMWGAEFYCSPLCWWYFCKLSILEFSPHHQWEDNPKYLTTMEPFVTARYINAITSQDSIAERKKLPISDIHSKKLSYLQRKSLRRVLEHTLTVLLQVLKHEDSAIFWGSSCINNWLEQWLKSQMRAKTSWLEKLSPQILQLSNIWISKPHFMEQN